MKKKREQPKDLTDDKSAPMDLAAAAKLPEQFLKKLLDLLEDKVAYPELHLDDKILGWELNFLQKHRPELFARPEASKPVQADNDICEGQLALAVKLVQHYTNPDGTSRLSFKITDKHVSNWCLLKAPEAAKNPPPGRMEGGTYRFSLSAWIAWVDQYVLPFKRAIGATSKAAAIDDEEDPVTMEQQEKRDAIIHRRWERAQKKGEYVHRSVAMATGIAAVKRLHLLVKQEDERNHTKLRREKLLEFGASPELVEIFSAWDKEQMRQATDRRETEMQSVGFEFPKEAA